MTLKAEINRNRKLGVEHEFYVPVLGNTSRGEVQRQIAEVLTANGIRAIARNCDHSLLPPNVDIAVESDSSVYGTVVWSGVQQAAIEIKTRILTYDEYVQIVPKMLQIVQYLGGRVNSSCGYHVHLGLPEIRQRPTVIRSLFNLFNRFEPVVLGSLVSPSRRRNTYCQKMNFSPQLLHGCSSMSSFRRKLGVWQRYYGLNLTHLWEEQPHVEYRYHQGTIDPEKSRNWLVFCVQMQEHAVTRNCQSARNQVPDDKTGINRLLTTCGFRQQHGIYEEVSPELRETGRYLLLKRFRVFKKIAVSGSGEDA